MEKLHGTAAKSPEHLAVTSVNIATNEKQLEVSALVTELEELRTKYERLEDSSKDLVDKLTAQGKDMVEKDHVLGHVRYLLDKKHEEVDELEQKVQRLRNSSNIRNKGKEAEIAGNFRQSQEGQRRYCTPNSKIQLQS